MGSPSVIDIEALLAPISPENPSGVELIATSPSFLQLKDIYNSSKDSERRLRRMQMFSGGDGEMDEDTERELASIPDPEWDEVIERACEILKQESKDIRVCAWLIEGLIRSYGLAGLRDGLHVCQGLCSDAFWATINPPPDEDGHERTVAQLTGIMGDAAKESLSDIPLTQGDPPLSMKDYVVAASLESVDGATREKRLQSGAVSFEMFRDAVRKSPGAMYPQMLEDIEEAIASLRAISDFLDANCLNDSYDSPTAPSVIPMRNALEEIADVIKSTAQTHLDAAEAEAAEPENGQAVEGDGSGGGAKQVTHQVTRMSQANVVDRDDAFRSLEKIADYFEKAEPLSPLCHHIRQAVKWGNMSYSELISDLIRDESVRMDIFRRIGVTPPENQ